MYVGYFVRLVEGIGVSVVVGYCSVGSGWFCRRESFYVGLFF